MFSDKYDSAEITEATNFQNNLIVDYKSESIADVSKSEKKNHKDIFELARIITHRAYSRQLRRASSII